MTKPNERDALASYRAELFAAQERHIEAIEAALHMVLADLADDRTVSAVDSAREALAALAALKEGRA